MMFVRLCDIANPVIVPEVINVQGTSAEVPDSLLEDFRTYIGNPPQSENDNLKRHLKSVLDEIGDPSSRIGIELGIRTWQITVPLNGKRVVYLPNWNRVNVDAVSVDSAGKGIEEIEWTELAATNKPSRVPLVTTDTATLPANVLFTYTSGFNNDLPDPIRALVFIEASFRIEFPVGVGDRGEDLVAIPAAARKIRREWQMVTDLSLYFN